MFFRHLVFMYFFCRPKGEKTYFRPICQSLLSSYNIHVRHFAFVQYIVYIVSYKRTDHFKRKLFYISFLKKNILFVKKIELNNFPKKLSAIIQKSSQFFYRGIIPEHNAIYFTILC